MKHQCLGNCGRLIAGTARCPTCRTQQRTKYAGNWRTLSQTAIAQHVTQHGWNCPGWKHPPHPSHDLTTDHQTGVLCRACNSRKKQLGDN